MNKAELKAQYQAFLEAERLSSDEVIVGSGGAMLLLGLRTETADVDVSVSSQTFSRLKKIVERRHFFCSGSRKVLVLEWNGVIDVHDQDLDCSTVLVEGVRCWSAAYVLEFKRMLNRPKDRADIAKLEAMLK